MFKLLKYEFRKARTALLALLGVIAGLDLYFLISWLSAQEVHFVIAAMLLMLASFGGMIFVLVCGVTSYASELKNRSSYLIFMTPNSGLKIMGSKFLYTFLNALLIAGICAGLAVMDVAVILTKEAMWADMLAFISRLLETQGIFLRQLGLFLLCMAVYLMLSMLSFCALTYLATTLSHTLFRDKKWRWIVSLAIFFALNWGLNQLNGLFPDPVEQMVIIESNAMGVRQTAAVQEQTITTFTDLIPWLLPYAGTSLATILVSLFGCAWMLDKKVSL